MRPAIVLTVRTPRAAAAAIAPGIVAAPALRPQTALPSAKVEVAR